MDYYKSVLEALRYLLEVTGEKHWSKWIAEDIYAWKNEKSVYHHLQAFGGMGSLNDLVLCVMNKHTITPKQEPWANTLLIELKSLSYMMAKRIANNAHPDITEIKRGTLRNSPYSIQGVRCLICGFAMLTDCSIDSCISPQIVTEKIIEGLEQGQLSLRVSECLSADLPIIEAAREHIKSMIKRSNICYKEHADFMRPCDKCKSDDTAVYRWIESRDINLFRIGKTRFKPSKDNLPLRSK